MRRAIVIIIIIVDVFYKHTNIQCEMGTDYVCEGERERDNYRHNIYYACLATNFCLFIFCMQPAIDANRYDTVGVMMIGIELSLYLSPAQFKYYHYFMQAEALFTVIIHFPSLFFRSFRTFINVSAPLSTLPISKRKQRIEIECVCAVRMHCRMRLAPLSHFSQYLSIQNFRVDFNRKKKSCPVVSCVMIVSLYKSFCFRFNDD